MSDDEPAPRPRDDEHDAAGLDLARSIARSLRGAKGRTPGRRPKRRRGTPDQVSGAHPDGRDPQSLDAAISRLVAEQGWAEDVAVHGVFARWDTIVGTEVAAHVKPERYTGTELVVRADATAWATQMRLLAAQVVRRLNEELGHGTVTKMVVLGPEPPSWRRGPRSVRGRGPRDTYG